MAEVELYQTQHFELAYFSTKNPVVEKENEDAGFFFFQDGVRVLAVADGVGGSRGGKQAAQLTLKSLESHLLEATEKNLEWRPEIVKACESANVTLLSQGIGAATTVMIVLLEENTMQTIHAGDSACLMVGRGGKVKYRSMDHTVVGYGQEAELIGDSEAQNHAAKHILLNCIGIPDMRMDIGPKKILKTADRILLGSDGLFDNFSDVEMAEMIRKGPLLKQAKHLRAACYDRMIGAVKIPHGKPDDLTFMLFSTKN